MGCPHKSAGKTTLRPYVGGQLFPLEELAAFCCQHVILEKGYVLERQENVKVSGAGSCGFSQKYLFQMRMDDCTFRTSGLLQRIFEYLWFLVCSCAVRSVPTFCSERQGPMEQTSKYGKGPVPCQDGNRHGQCSGQQLRKGGPVFTQAPGLPCA